MSARTPPRRAATRALAHAERAAASATPEEIAREKVQPGVMVGPERTDFGRASIGGLNPSTVRRLITAVLNGDAATAGDIYDAVLRSDLHLRCESNKRRMAVTQLPLEIVAAEGMEGDDGFDADKAAEVAQYCRSILRGLRGLNKALKHLNDARGRGVMAVEVEWATAGGERRPVALHCIPFNRIIFDPLSPWRLRITSETNQAGLAIDEFPAGKFIVHAPETLGGSALAGGLYVPSVYMSMFKRYGWESYFQTLEMFGAPIRTATYPPGASQETIDALRTMLIDVGKFAAGAFVEGSTFQLHESAANSGAGKGPPHPTAIDKCNAEQSKLWVGATLLTEVGTTGGNRALGDNMNGVRLDLCNDDIAGESEFCVEQFLRPVVLQKFGPEADIYVPTSRRVIEEPKDLEATGRLIWAAVNEGGAPVPMRVVQDELGLPLVDGTDLDAPLPGRTAGIDLLGPESVPVVNRDRGNRPGQGSPLREVAHSLMNKIKSRGGSLARIVPWMVAAVVASQAHTAAVAESLGAALKREEESIVTEADVGRVLAAAFGSLPIDDMVTLTRHALLAGELAGRAVALEKIARRGEGVDSSRRRNTDLSPATEDTRLAAHAAKIDFPKIPFVAAIERLRDRIGLDPETFLQLDAEARSRAWRVAGVWNMDLLAVLHTQLVSAIAAGETVRDFRQSVIGQMYDRAGWSGENPWHANIVFFQNFAMAHAAGRYREYVELGIEAYRIVSVGPACPICEPEIGKVYPVAKPRKYTPFHMGCDCEEEPVLPGELQPGELSDPYLVSNPALDAELARKGSLKWDVAAYGAMGPLNLAKYPKSLRPAFADLAAKQGWETVG